MKLLNVFNIVLLKHEAYKINKYILSLFKIVDVTSIIMIFSTALCVIKIWMWKYLCMDTLTYF